MTPAVPTMAAEDLDQTPPRHHPSRWRINRGGIVNVWYYYDSEFTCSGGRIIWRGTNGAGKSRALEMLLPYLLDADRRNIDASGAKKVRLEDLMAAGAGEKAGGNRVGYLWLELIGESDDSETEYLTLGAFIRFSKATAEAKPWYFITPLRVGVDLHLLDDSREPLSRDRLAEKIGSDRVTDTAETHRERVRTQVFALTGDSGRERYAGLLQLLHVLRNPDVGNRIEAGLLPAIVSDALPPLSEAALAAAGQQLDALSDTRDAQQRLEKAANDVGTFLATYRRYAAGVLLAANDQAKTTAASARRSARDSDDAHSQHEHLQAQHKQTADTLNQLADRAGELDATIRGIKASREYTDAQQLIETERRIAALHQTAERALANARTSRDAEAALVATSDERAGEVIAAADAAAQTLTETRDLLTKAGLTADLLPAAASATIDDEPATTESVRTDCESAPSPFERPTPRTLTFAPDEPRRAAETARHVARAAKDRAGQARNRHATAVALRDQMRKVEAAEDRAGDARDEADTAAEEAGQAAARRDDAAASLAVNWRNWVADPATEELLGPVGWHTTALAQVLADIDALAGDDGLPLDGFDRAADEAARPARQRISEDRADLKRRKKDVSDRRQALNAEAADLRRERDPEPARAPWQASTPTGGVPLWRAVDFTDPKLSDDDKAGIEGALHAAGLLTADLTSDGAVTAADGQILLTATGPTVNRPLSNVLAPDPTCPIEPGLSASVLARIALDDHDAPVWVARDGSWGSGPLTGRHRVPAASHIGAQARAAARAARLDEIATELGALADIDSQHKAEGDALGDREQQLDSHLRTAPRTRQLTQARADAAAQAQHARNTTGKAARLHAEAEGMRRDLDARRRQHAEMCRASGLPTGVEELATARQAAESAAGSCARLADGFTHLGECIDRHIRGVSEVQKATANRMKAESTADEDWALWHHEAAELSALRETIGADPEAVFTRLKTAEDEARRTKRTLSDTRKVEGELGRQVAAAAVTAKHKKDEASAARRALADEVARLHRVATLPGITQAALNPGQSLPHLPAADPVSIDPATVETAARQLADTVDRSGPTVDETAVVRAQQRLEQDLTGTFDVQPTVTDGVRLVDLVDAAGTHTIAAAHTTLQRKVDEGRTALSDRERQVFTKFILDGVADELQRRLGQAHKLIKAMNASLRAIHTSHGIGVRVQWTLKSDATSALTRISELIAVANDVRSEADNAELIDLLKARVDGQMNVDANAGYTAHLKSALDYRSWHDVEVIIRGPAAGQERRISKRSKLSQGETRFVSYVTLFAAVDAYLSGLPDTSRALRLIVLDDAFAKVDNRTIGVLMGLLVRLDIDFAMTGHALWGCYPQVPSLDVYEVRRREGSAAITTHVHWDGHSRHLRSVA